MATPEMSQPRGSGLAAAGGQLNAVCPPVYQHIYDYNNGGGGGTDAIDYPCYDKQGLMPGLCTPPAHGYHAPQQGYGQYAAPPPPPAANLGYAGCYPAESQMAAVYAPLPDDHHNSQWAYRHADAATKAFARQYPVGYPTMQCVQLADGYAHTTAPPQWCLPAQPPFHHIPDTVATSMSADAMPCAAPAGVYRQELAVGAAVGVSVPFGWHRIVSNGSVVYYSPSGVALASLTQLRQYLLSHGTCKCGLGCPLVVEHVFNFDPRVPSRPACNLSDNGGLGSLCHHRRRLMAMAAFQHNAAAMHGAAVSEPRHKTAKAKGGGTYGSVKKRRKTSSSSSSSTQQQQQQQHTSSFEGMLVSQLLSPRDKLCGSAPMMHNSIDEMCCENGTIVGSACSPRDIETNKPTGPALNAHNSAGYHLGPTVNQSAYCTPLGPNDGYAMRAGHDMTPGHHPSFYQNVHQHPPPPPPVRNATYPHNPAVYNMHPSHNAICHNVPPEYGYHNVVAATATYNDSSMQPLAASACITQHSQDRFFATNCLPTSAPAAEHAANQNAMQTYRPVDANRIVAPNCVDTIATTTTTGAVCTSVSSLNVVCSVSLDLFAQCSAAPSTTTTTTGVGKDVACSDSLNPPVSAEMTRCVSSADSVTVVNTVPSKCESLNVSPSISQNQCASSKTNVSEKSEAAMLNAVVCQSDALHRSSTAAAATWPKPSRKRRRRGLSGSMPDADTCHAGRVPETASPSFLRDPVAFLAEKFASKTTSASASTSSSSSTATPATTTTVSTLKVEDTMGETVKCEPPTTVGNSCAYTKLTTSSLPCCTTLSVTTDCHKRLAARDAIDSTVGIATSDVKNHHPLTPPHPLPPPPSPPLYHTTNPRHEFPASVLLSATARAQIAHPIADRPPLPPPPVAAETPIQLVQNMICGLEATQNALAAVVTESQQQQRVQHRRRQRSAARSDAPPPPPQQQQQQQQQWCVYNTPAMPPLSVGTVTAVTNAITQLIASSAEHSTQQQVEQQPASSVMQLVGGGIAMTSSLVFGQQTAAPPSHIPFEQQPQQPQQMLAGQMLVPPMVQTENIGQAYMTGLGALPGNPQMLVVSPGNANPAVALQTAVDAAAGTPVMYRADTASATSGASGQEQLRDGVQRTNKPRRRDRCKKSSTPTIARMLQAARAAPTQLVISQQPLLQQPSQQSLLQPSQQPLLQPSQQPLLQPSQQPLLQPSQQPLLLAAVPSGQLGLNIGQDNMGLALGPTHEALSLGVGPDGLGPAQLGQLGLAVGPGADTLRLCHLGVAESGELGLYSLTQPPPPPPPLPVPTETSEAVAGAPPSVAMQNPEILKQLTGLAPAMTSSCFTSHSSESDAGLTSMPNPSNLTQAVSALMKGRFHDDFGPVSQPGGTPRGAGRHRGGVTRRRKLLDGNPLTGTAATESAAAAAAESAATESTAAESTATESAAATTESAATESVATESAAEKSATAESAAEKSALTDSVNTEMFSGNYEADDNCVVSIAPTTKAAATTRSTMTHFDSDSSCESSSACIGGTASSVTLTNGCLSSSPSNSATECLQQELRTEKLLDGKSCVEMSLAGASEPVFGTTFEAYSDLSAYRNNVSEASTPCGQSLDEDEDDDDDDDDDDEDEEEDVEDEEDSEDVTENCDIMDDTSTDGPLVVSREARRLMADSEPSYWTETEDEDDYNLVLSEPATNAQQTRLKRVFNIGDLVWGQIRGYPSWPGKLVAASVVKGHHHHHHHATESGKLWVKWFGDHTFTQVEPDKLKTLSEGLEDHHRETKKHRKGRKMNSSLESAIQEAMLELDKPSASGRDSGISLSPCSTERAVARPPGVTRPAKIRVGGKRNRSR